MKKFILIIFTLFCFGIARAHVVKKIHPCFTQKTFIVSGINHLKNYEVTFRFFAGKKVFYGPAPKADSFQNRLMMSNESLEYAFDKLRHQFPLSRRLSLSKPPVKN